MLKKLFSENPLKVIRARLHQTMSTNELSYNAQGLLASFVSQLDVALASKDNLSILMSILKQIELIKFSSILVEQSFLSEKSQSPENDEVFGRTLSRNDKVFFTSTAKEQEIALPVNEKTIFSNLHKELLDTIKKQHNAEWIFDYTPNPAYLKNWQDSLQASLKKQDHLEKTTQAASLDFNERGVQFFVINKKGKKKKLTEDAEDVIEAAVALTDFDDKQSQILIQWLELNGGQVLNSFVNINLIGKGLVKVLSDPNEVPTLMGCKAKQEWCVNKGQMEATLNIKSSLLNFPLAGEFLVFAEASKDTAGQKYHFKNPMDPDFDDKEAKSGNAPPVLEIEAKIILAIVNGEVVPQFKELYLISHTELLDSPARFEEPKYANDPIFSPTAQGEPQSPPSPQTGKK